MDELGPVGVQVEGLLPNMSDVQRSFLTKATSGLAVKSYDQSRLGTPPMGPTQVIRGFYISHGQEWFLPFLPFYRFYRFSMTGKNQDNNDISRHEKMIWNSNFLCL